jgi:hypothetical protein
MRDIAAWAFPSFAILFFWPAFWPKQFVRILARLFSPVTGNREVPALVIPVFRVVGILVLLGALFGIAKHFGMLGS